MAEPRLRAAPVATAAVAAIIFIADAITAEKLTVSVSYVVVVLLAARFTSARGVVLVGAGIVERTQPIGSIPGEHHRFKAKVIAVHVQPASAFDRSSRGIGTQGSGVARHECPRLHGDSAAKGIG